MANFIEITLESGNVELLNTNSIEMVYVNKGNTIITYSKISSSGAISVRVKNDYEEIKKKLLQ